jgi:antirestriction protein
VRFGYPNSRPLAFPPETCHTTSIPIKGDPMSVTLTVNYKEVFKAETVEFIDELLEDNYDLNSILEFVDEHSEEDLLTYYVDYVDQGEKCGFDIVDAFVELNGFCEVEHCEDAYVGCYADGADFAEEMIEAQGGINIDFAVIDYDMTWERGLAYDYDIVEKGFRNCYIFRKYY